MGSPRPVVLNYSSPRVFLQGRFRTRTVGGVVWAVLLCALGLIMLLSSRSPLSAASGAVAVTCLLLGGWCLVGPSVLGPDVPVRITEDGIEVGRESWDWQDVSYLGGNVVVLLGRRVELFFDVRRAFPPRRKLPLTPRLSWPAYTKLTDELQAFLSERHPDVTVERADPSGPRPGE